VVNYAEQSRFLRHSHLLETLSCLGAILILPTAMKSVSIFNVRLYTERTLQNEVGKVLRRPLQSTDMTSTDCFMRSSCTSMRCARFGMGLYRPFWRYNAQWCVVYYHTHTIFLSHTISDLKQRMQYTKLMKDGQFLVVYDYMTDSYKAQAQRRGA